VDVVTSFISVASQQRKTHLGGSKVSAVLLAEPDPVDGLQRSSAV